MSFISTIVPEISSQEAKQYDLLVEIPCFYQFVVASAD
jgi:hypothetical protein